MCACACACACVCVYVYSSLPVGGCLLRCFSVTLWFCYFQLETGCDSDCMVDCVIEWYNHTHVHIDTHTYTLGHTVYAKAHRHIRWQTHTTHRGKKKNQTHTHTHTRSSEVLYAHTPRVSGNVAGSPPFTEAPEGERADDGAPPEVDTRFLVSVLV